jgi:hypothetical protein
MGGEDGRPGTALVPIAPAPAGDGLGRPAPRARAVFLAHLIATGRQAPQTCARRRAELDEAARAYQAGLARVIHRPALSRSL